MTLTKENIQYINLYLKKNNVIFDDIRIELVDHISSAVEFEMVKNEKPFNTAFLEFIKENKVEILKAGKVYKKWDFPLAYKTFFQFLKNKNIIIVTIVLFLTFQKNFFEFIRENIGMIQVISVLVIIVMCLGWLLFFTGIFKRRFFAIENNFNVSILFINAFNLARILTQPKSDLAVNLTLTYSILTFLFIWFVVKNTYDFYIKNKELYAFE